MSELVALAVGIDAYQHLQPLRYAAEDAGAFRDYLVENVGVPTEQCLILSDRSLDWPTIEHFKTTLERLCSIPYQPSDVLWVLFSGYAVNHAGRDYLLLADSHPDTVTETGMAVDRLFDRLQTLSLDRIFVFLDINRPTAPHTGQNISSGIAELARKAGITVLLSCQSDQHSRETRYLRHGLFTYALLEALQDRDCQTLAQLEAYLGERLPQLGEQYWQPPQTPVFVTDDETRSMSLFPDRKLSSVSIEPSPSRASSPVLQLFGALGAIAVFLMVGVLSSLDFQGSDDRDLPERETVAAETDLDESRAFDLQLMQDARSSIEPQQASSYWRAIETLQHIPPDRSLYNEARQQIDAWSWEILNLARARAASGQQALAVETARLVPPNTAAYAVAKDEIDRWQSQNPQSPNRPKSKD
ncbi:MAG: caspase family protein [Cyanobacteria bacterium SID2]|nr:caspase family protein [Cyanobacteria bacterium SID2]MBP0006430.1 caspase family protein [Cyanobacteria bacterium SBC]